MGGCERGGSNSDVRRASTVKPSRSGWNLQIFYGLADRGNTQQILVNITEGVVGT